MSTTLDNLCHNLVKDGGRRATGEPGEQTGEVFTGGAGVDAEALSFLGEGCTRNVPQEGCTGLGGDVVGKASDVDRGVQGARWNGSTEAVSSGTDTGVVAGAGSAFSGFQCIGTGQGNGRIHGRHLGGGGEQPSIKQRNDGEDAEGGEDGQHVEHITGGRWQGKRFLKKVFSSPKGDPYSIRYSWGFSKSGFPATEAGSDRTRFILVLGSFRPVIGGHIPSTIDLGAGEDHHPLTPLLGEEDGLGRVIHLGDGGGGVKAEEGAKVGEGHRVLLGTL